MMELMVILRLVIHLMLAGWIPCSDATDCTLHIHASSQSSMVSLRCPNSESVCQLELQNPQGTDCYSNTPNCYIDNCNQEYNICDISQNQSSSRCRQLSNGGQGVHNSDPPINCTVDIVPQRMEIYLTCPKGECRHRATARGSNYTKCSRYLGIACEEPTGCSKLYSIYAITEPLTNTEAQPTTTASSEINKTAFNQICNETVSIQSCPNSVTVTLHSSIPVYISTTPVYWGSDYHADIRKPTATPNRTVTSTSTTVTVASDRPILLKIVVPVAGVITGLLIVLLLVVISGLVCTCRIMKKRGKMEKSIMQNGFSNRISTADDQQTYTQTQQRFDDNPLFKEHVIPPQAHPNPPQQQRQEHVYSIPLATKRRDNKEPTHQNIQNELNRGCSATELAVVPELRGGGCSSTLSSMLDTPLIGGGVLVGGANQIPGKIEHKYNHLVKIVKQTEGGQSKRDERVSFERNQKFHTSDKQERDITLQYQAQEYLIPIKQEPKRFQNRPNKGLFQDGGASVGVGVASQFPRQQGEIEHQYDPLIKNVKKKDCQRKRDEGTDKGEMNHGYHELEGPGDDYDYPEEKERDIVYHVLDGPTPIETDLKTSQNRSYKVYSGEGVSMGGATQFPRKQKACDHQYDQPVKAAKKGGQSKRDGGADAERDHDHHVLEGPPGSDIHEYDYPAEREGPEIVYHVLDGPTPVEEETQFIN